MTRTVAVMPFLTQVGLVITTGVKARRTSGSATVTRSAATTYEPPPTIALGAKDTAPAGPLTVIIGVASVGSPSTTMASVPIPVVGHAAGMGSQPGRASTGAAASVGVTDPSGAAPPSSPQPNDHRPKTTRTNGDDGRDIQSTSRPLDSQFRLSPK